MNFAHDIGLLTESRWRTRLISRDALWRDPIRLDADHVEHNSILKLSQSQSTIPGPWGNSLAHAEEEE